MQILIIGLFVALYLHDSTTQMIVSMADGGTRDVEALPGDCWPFLGFWPVLALVLLPKLLLAVSYQLACMRTRRRLGTDGGQRSMRRLEAFTSILPIMLLMLFASDLALGGLRELRIVLRHTLLIDELLILLPTLATAALAWWSYYPIDRRLREALIFRLADAGKPVYPLQTRGQYLSQQMRHQLVLLLPMLAVFTWAEALALLGPDHHHLLSAQAVALLTPVGVLGVFLLSPLSIRYIWHTTALAPGEVRSRMTSLCEQHRVRVRELLVWRTGGGLVNAAVTGLIRQLRYILLSDGLLDQVTPRQVEAVMAHEIAHIKLHHMIWMALVLITSLGILETSASIFLVELLLPALGNEYSATILETIGIDLYDPQTQGLISSVPAFAITFFVFGWVSRRIERQADVFAARHLAQTREQPQVDDLGKPVFDDDSVETMVAALQRVADLNHAPVNRKSWRHGSIAWRQEHLRSLVGTPLDASPVDAVMSRVKIATLIALAALILAYLV